MATDPEEHLVTWTIDDERRHGVIVLGDDASPHGVATRVGAHAASKNFGLLGPMNVTPRQVIHGWMRSNRQVALIDAHVASPRLPDDYDRLTSRWAVVGNDIARGEPPAFQYLEAHISHIDRVIWPPPLHSVSWPADIQPGSTFSVELGQTEHEWIDDLETWKVSQRINFPLTPYYEYRLSFRPAVYFETRKALPLDELIQERLLPLTRLISFLTSTESQVHQVYLAPTTEEDEHGNRAGRVKAFGPGIHQGNLLVPLHPHVLEEKRPLLRLDRLPGSLPVVVRRWRSLEQSANPFLALFETAKLIPPAALPARYLALVLALEGLDSHEHSFEEAEKASTHKLKRSVVVGELRSHVLHVDTLAFISDNLSRRPLFGLSNRLRRLIKWLPSDWQTELEVSETNPLRQTLVAEYPTETFADQLGRIRNRLAHGTGVFDRTTLLPWVEALEWLARGHVLRLLGCAPSDLPSMSDLRQP